MSTIVSSKARLHRWERAFLVLPALAGLFFGFFPLFLPAWFANFLQSPAKNLYIYQLAGAATLGYGVTLSLSLFQQAWLPLRLPLIGVLVFSLASLYACVAALFEGQASLAIFLGLGLSLFFVVITGLLFARHREVPRSHLLRARGVFRALLVLGGISATIFGLVPLFLPDVFVPLFHLHAGTEGIAREAGAACLGYAALSLLVQQGVERQELPLIAVMAGVFNGVSSIVSIAVLLTGTVFVLPWIIVPVGLTALAGSVWVLRTGLLPGKTKTGSLPTHTSAGRLHIGQK